MFHCLALHFTAIEGDLVSCFNRYCLDVKRLPRGDPLPTRGSFLAQFDKSSHPAKTNYPQPPIDITVHLFRTAYSHHLLQTWSFIAQFDKWSPLPKPTPTSPMKWSWMRQRTPPPPENTRQIYIWIIKITITFYQEWVVLVLFGVHRVWAAATNPVSQLLSLPKQTLTDPTLFSPKLQK